MKKIAAILICCVLLALAGCRDAVPSSVPASMSASAASIPASGSGAGEALPGVEVPEKALDFNIQSDLPQGCNVLEVYGFGCNTGTGTGTGYFICRAMDFSGEAPAYLGEETEEVSYLSDAFFTPSDIDLTTGEPRS